VPSTIADLSFLLLVAEKLEVAVSAKFQKLAKNKDSFSSKFLYFKSIGKFDR
jgi:hypothetical protein